MKHKLNHFAGMPKNKHINGFNVVDEYKALIEREKALLSNYETLSASEKAYLLNVYKNHVAMYYYLLRGGHR